MIWSRTLKRPEPTYPQVRNVAEVLSRSNASLIQKHFSLPPQIADEFMRRLVEEALFGPIQDDGWHYPSTRKSRPRFDTEKPKVHANEDRRDASTNSPGADELKVEVRKLTAKVKRLQSAGKTVIAQREEWRKRALAAEAQAMDLTSKIARHQSTTADDRFDKVRRLIAKELHPDFCTAGAIEKTVRQEFFKKLWPEIERLSERRQ